MKDKTFLKVADVISEESKCVSYSVACVIVRDDRIVSIGYNGTPAGYLNCNDVHVHRGDEHSAWSQRYEIHAEMNALLYAAKNGISVDGATMYCTLQPCWQCTKNLIQAGIERVVYSQKYERLEEEDQKLQEFLSDNGVKSEFVKIG